MKKFLALLLIAALMFSPAVFAAEVMQGIDSAGNKQNVSVDSTGLLNTGRSPASSTPIAAVLFDADPTTYTSAAITLNGAQRVGFFVTYDETEVGNSISAAVTLEVSPNGTTWFAANFYDVAGAATMQTTETISADGSYICWLDSKMPFGYARIKVIATNTDADDTALVSAVAYYDR